MGRSLMLMEFGLVFANDWFLVPLPSPESLEILTDDDQG